MDHKRCLQVLHDRADLLLVPFLLTVRGREAKGGLEEVWLGGWLKVPVFEGFVW